MGLLGIGGGEGLENSTFSPHESLVTLAQDLDDMTLFDLMLFPSLFLEFDCDVRAASLKLASTISYSY